MLDYLKKRFRLWLMTEEDLMQMFVNAPVPCESDNMVYNRFLEHYRIYTSGNETPDSIHLWTGLACVAGAAERRLWLRRGPFDLILNLYIMFLAPAGACAKSTAAGLGGKLLEEIGAKVFEGSITKRKIVSDMQENIQIYTKSDGDAFAHSSITFLADEFNELMSSGGGEIIKFLTTIFSKGDRYIDRTQTQGCFELPRPCLTIVGNVVPQWFASSLANDMSATGLLARFIIVSENEKRGCYSKPTMTAEQLHHRQKCVEILYWIYQQFGELEVADDAEAFFDVWYNKQKVNPGDDVRIVDYMERKIKIHVLKGAALMALGDCRKTIEVNDIKLAIHIIEIEERKLRITYNSIGTNKYSVYIQRILSILDSFGGKFPVRKLAQLLYANLTNDEIVAIIKQLHMMDMAKMEKIKGVAYLVRSTGEESHNVEI